jgi:peptide/nickel transport system substrate-binding protein
VKLVEGGRADVLVNLGALPGQHRLRLHDASWLRTHSQMGTNFWALNTRAKPFDDVRVRRALNYALDRRVYVGIEGGSEAAEPTCQLLPPLVPGYRRYCPYTRSPSPSGRYLGPDLRRARALVAASGTRGMRVTIWDALDDRGGGSEGGYLATVLRKLGYRTSVHRLDNNHIFLYSNDSRNHAQIIPGGWSADYPSASDFIGKLTCANFVPGDGASTNDSSELCSRALDRAIARADALQATDARAGAAAWARLDRKLTNLAIWLPTTIVKNTDFVSPRVGNYEYHPLWGAMIDQLWVK